MYDIVRYRVRYPYDIGRKIVRLFALIVRYLYVIAPYIGRTSAVNRSYIALVRCTLHLPPVRSKHLDLGRYQRGPTNVGSSKFQLNGSKFFRRSKNSTLRYL